MLCSPDQIRSQVEELAKLRDDLCLDYPSIIWEPSPLACVYENLSTCLDRVQLVEVFSPNHLELLSLFGRSSEDFSKPLIEKLSLKVVQAGVGKTGRGTVIIRAGEYGCLILSAERCPVWLPPYYDANGNYILQPKIVDITGAGNAFLGGYAIGFNETQDVISAACYGIVSASFVLEQIGTPEIVTKTGVIGAELWNNENPRKRLQLYKSRLERNLQIK